MAGRECRIRREEDLGFGKCFNGQVENIPVDKKETKRQGIKKTEDVISWKPMENNVSRTKSSLTSNILRIQIK